MVFSSAFFLFGFLPIVLLLYYASPRALKNSVLLLASMFFYAWGEQQYCVVLFGSILGNYVAGVWLAKRRSKRLLFAAVAGNLLVLIAFKYANFIVDNINLITGQTLFRLKPVHLPIGVSFFTFQGIAYVVDVYTRQVKPAPNPVRYALYAALFPHLVAGPIVRYRDIEDQLGERPASLDQFASGIRRLMVGLAKKLIIANTLGQYADTVFRLPPGDLTAGAAWLGLACYTLQIYFDFSGYSDMAIGLGKMFGFTFLENFAYPYIATSVTEFWRRWHISLSTWLRDYLYIPLGGNRGSAGRTYVNLMIVFVLCGFWHGASWTFVIWGIWHGGFLVLERLLRGRSPLPAPLGHAYALVAVMLGWVFFRADTLPQALGYMRALAGLSAGGVEFADLWTRELLFGFAVAVPCCLPFVPWLRRRWGVREDDESWGRSAWEWSSIAVCGSLGIALIPCLSAGSYNPFLYFRF